MNSLFSRFDVNLGGSSESSPVLRPAPGSLAAQEASARIGLAPPGDSSPPVIDESPAVSALGWPHQAAEALEAASASQNPEGNPASDVDSLLGLASAAASASSASTSRGPVMSASKFNKPHILDSVERRANALAILRLICESPVFLHQLEAILAARDAQGMFFSKIIGLKYFLSKLKIHY